jgi:hypothetical protein
VEKGLARGTILEGRDDLVISHFGELTAVLGEAANVVIETIALLLPAMAKIASIARPGIGLLEVPYEGVSKLSLAVDPSQGRCSSQLRAELVRYRGMLLMMNRLLLASP